MDDSESSSGPQKADSTHFPYLSSLNDAQLSGVLINPSPRNPFAHSSAVTSDPAIPLQILAGPGSGKTRVLTSRVAYLVQKHQYKPYEITAVTFTNKAANEMRKRLRALLGEKQADNLVLGTFHAMCAKFLRRYSKHVSLPNNFAILDADDSKKVMKDLIKAKSEIIQASGMAIKEGAVLSDISKAKAKGESPEMMAVRAARDPSSSTSTLTLVAELYAEYEAALRESDSLDFDDLLVFGLKLFKTVPEVLSSCKHILVDEFQDTNTTQYELMKCFANVNNGLTVVGDPDQSIYGWRSAEVENLNKMTHDFKGVQAIYLEQNYRSTGSILAAAHSIVSQDRERIQKKLFTSHPKSTPVTLKTFSTPVIEASFVATEIKRLIAYSGGVLNYGDFAILLRYNALSRVIESALQKDSIPNRIVGGHKFFERMEIKDLLAYLQLAENPGFTPAFLRVINVPKRSIGDKSVADLVSAAKALKISPMELCERITDGDQLPAGIRPGIKRNLANFVGAVKKLRRAADKGASVADLLKMAIEKTDYEQHLRTTQQDFDSRWENVQELISYSVIVAEEQAREAELDTFFPDEGFVPASSAAVEAAVELAAKKEAEAAEKKVHPMFRRQSSNGSSRSRSASVVVEEKPPKRARGPEAETKARKKMKGVKEEPIEIVSDDEAVESDAGDVSPGPGDSKDDVAHMKPLSYFLQTSMLSTDTQDANKDDPASQQKVTLITVHAAKGLEWPVVFIPAVEQGTYPSYRCTEAHEIAEERRLLYVAMTRAQGFLTLSNCNYRMMGGEENDKSPSEFVELSARKDPKLFTVNLPDIDLAVRRNLASMLGRPSPNEETTTEMIRKHIRAAPPLSMWDAPEPQDRNFNRFARREVTKATRAAEYWASEADDYALPDLTAGFASARTAPHHSSSHGNHSSRLSKPYQMSSPNPSSPQKPVVKIPQRNHNLPAPLPFTFGSANDSKKDTGLGMFTNTNNDALNAMKSLGLPDGGGSGGGTAGLGLPFGGGSDWRTLAQPSATGQAAAPVALAKGTKRLGMGRPAPWGSKK